MSQNFSAFGWILSKQKMDLLIFPAITSLIAPNKDGAGAIVFRDATDNQNIIAVRGTDIPNNIREDIAADWGISVGILPMYQTSLIDNFIARETAPAAASVPKVKFDNQLRD